MLVSDQFCDILEDRHKANAFKEVIGASFVSVCLCVRWE